VRETQGRTTRAAANPFCPPLAQLYAADVADFELIG